jgi:hypothetical protein
MFDCSLKKEDLESGQLNGKTLKQIKNPDLKQMITNYLLQTYGIKMNCTNKYFRAIDLVNDVTLLKKYRHLAYINTNQKTSLLILATFDGAPVCLFVDKQTASFYLLQCQFSLSLYQGTIMEGEVVDSLFMISDFLVYLQKDITNHPLDRRLNLLHSILEPKNYQHDTFVDPFKIVIKDFVETDQLVSYVKDYLPRTAYGHRVSGLIFRPNENSNKNLIYNFNTVVSKDPREPRDPRDQSVQRETSDQRDQRDQRRSPVDYVTLKINPVSHPEVKFMLFELGNPDDYYLKIATPDGQLIEYDYALVNDLKTSQYLQRLLEETPQHIKNKGFCFLCQYLPNFKKWKPTRLLNGSEAVPDIITKLVN